MKTLCLLFCQFVTNVVHLFADSWMIIIEIPLLGQLERAFVITCQRFPSVHTQKVHSKSIGG